MELGPGLLDLLDSTPPKPERKYSHTPAPPSLPKTADLALEASAGRKRPFSSKSTPNSGTKQKKRRAAVDMTSAVTTAAEKGLFHRLKVQQLLPPIYPTV
jgi:hypothetical protein